MQTQNTDINAESEISHLCTTQILRKSKWHSDGIISLSGKKNRYLWFYTEFFSTLSYSFPLCLKTKTEEALGMHTLSKFIACLTWLKKKFNSDAVLLSCFSGTQFDSTRQEHNGCPVQTSCSGRATQLWSGPFWILALILMIALDWNLRFTLMTLRRLLLNLRL